MPKTPTFPTTFDSCQIIDISKLKRWGYLKSNQISYGTLTWTRNGNKTGSIGFHIDTLTETPYIEVDYKSSGKLIKYKVQLVSLPSNLGKGVIWYFRCPRTWKRCRKLHCIGGYFLHRSAFSGCFYEKQLQSRHYRYLERTFGCLFETDRLYEQLHKKHFKKTYNGKPTRRYLKLMQRIKANERDEEEALREYQKEKLFK